MMGNLGKKKEKKKREEKGEKKEEEKKEVKRKRKKENIFKLETSPLSDPKTKIRLHKSEILSPLP